MMTMEVEDPVRLIERGVSERAISGEAGWLLEDKQTKGRRGWVDGQTSAQGSKYLPSTCMMNLAVLDCCN